jgi:hypothetical protein
MTQCRDYARLVCEAFTEFSRRSLDRDDVIELLVAGLVDFPRPAWTDSRKDFIIR